MLRYILTGWMPFLTRQSTEGNSDEVLAWLSVWGEVQMIWIWSSWCHCHSSSLASV